MKWIDENVILCRDILKIHDGIGDKIGSLFQFVAGAIAGFVIGFYYGWKLTLVILSVSPLLAVSAGAFSKVCPYHPLLSLLCFLPFF